MSKKKKINKTDSTKNDFKEKIVGIFRISQCNWPDVLNALLKEIDDFYENYSTKSESKNEARFQVGIIEQVHYFIFIQQLFDRAEQKRKKPETDKSDVLLSWAFEYLHMLAMNIENFDNNDSNRAWIQLGILLGTGESLFNLFKDRKETKEITKKASEIIKYLYLTYHINDTLKKSSSCFLGIARHFVKELYCIAAEITNVIRAEDGNNVSSTMEHIGGSCISPENQTRPISKTELAKMFGKEYDDKMITKMIKANVLPAVELTRQSYIFDKSKLPPKVKEKL